MVTKAEVDALTTQVEKIGLETDKLKQLAADLQAVIDSQGGVSAEIQASFDALKAAIQNVDDKVADAP